jgi:hypothetical protein
MVSIRYFLDVWDARYSKFIPRAAVTSVNFAGIEVADGSDDFCSTGGLGSSCAGEYEGNKLKRAMNNAGRPHE